MKSPSDFRIFSRTVNPSCRRAGGFTIMELLVATGITTLLVSLMLTVVVNVMQGWSRSSGTLNTGAQARLILTQMASDLQGAIMKRDGNVWLAATIQQNQDVANKGLGDANVTLSNWAPLGVKKPSDTAADPSLRIPKVGTTTPDLTQYRFGQGGVWLRFFTGVSDKNESSDPKTLSAPRAVAYQIIRLPTNRLSNGTSVSNEYRYLLFRSEVRPGHETSTVAIRSTFVQGYNLFMVPDTVPGVTYVNYNDPNGTNAGDSEPGSIRRPERTQVICNNVVDFGVRFWGRNATTGQLEIQFPTSNTNWGYAATITTTATPPAPRSPLKALNPPIMPVNMSYGFPEVAEIFVRILNDEGVKQLDLLEKGTVTLPAGETWWTIVEKNSQVYTRRVDIKAQAF